MTGTSDDGFKYRMNAREYGRLAPRGLEPPEKLVPLAPLAVAHVLNLSAILFGPALLALLAWLLLTSKSLYFTLVLGAPLFALGMLATPFPRKSGSTKALRLDKAAAMDFSLGAASSPLTSSSWNALQDRHSPLRAMRKDGAPVWRQELLVDVTAEEQPRLFEALDKLCAAMKLPRPSRLRFDCGMDEPSFSRLAPGLACLRIGIPCVGAVSDEGLFALVCRALAASKLLNPYALPIIRQGHERLCTAASYLHGPKPILSSARRAKSDEDELWFSETPRQRGNILRWIPFAAVAGMAALNRRLLGKTWLQGEFEADRRTARLLGGAPLADALAALDSAILDELLAECAASGARLADAYPSRFADKARIRLEVAPDKPHDEGRGFELIKTLREDRVNSLRGQQKSPSAPGAERLAELRAELIDELRYAAGIAARPLLDNAQANHARRAYGD